MASDRACAVTSDKPLGTWLAARGEPAEPKSRRLAQRLSGQGSGRPLSRVHSGGQDLAESRAVP
jgi:hypothetical protein